MARADVYTRIPLDRAAQILGIDPLHFNSVVSDNRPEVYACDDLWFQYPSQRIGQASRDDLAIALRSAEDQVFVHLGYPLVPIWVQEEEQPLVVPGNLNSRGHHKSIRTSSGYIIAGGVRAKSLISAAAAVVYSDADGDGYAETATVTVPTSVTDGQEVHVYYPSKAGADAWEIRPITVTLSGGNAVIVFKKELAVDENLIEKYPSPDDPTIVVDGDDNNNFLATVDVYRVYHDGSDHGTMYGESSCDDNSPATGTVELVVRNGPLGIFAYSQMDWNATDLEFNHPASPVYEAYRILLNYRAGVVNHFLPRPYLDMEPQWERAIVYYAVSLLDREVSGCENTHNIWAKQSEDLALSDQGKSYSVAFADLSNPLGTTRAALNLWKMIKRHRKAIR